MTKLRPSDEEKTREETTIFDILVHCDLPESHFGPEDFPRLAQVIHQCPQRYPAANVYGLLSSFNKLVLTMSLIRSEL
jgi:hypothetical protein